MATTNWNLDSVTAETKASVRRAACERSAIVTIRTLVPTLREVGAALGVDWRTLRIVQRYPRWWQVAW